MYSFIMCHVSGCHVSYVFVHVSCVAWHVVFYLSFATIHFHLSLTLASTATYLPLVTPPLGAVGWFAKGSQKKRLSF